VDTNWRMSFSASPESDPSYRSAPRARDRAVVAFTARRSKSSDGAPMRSASPRRTRSRVRCGVASSCCPVRSTYSREAARSSRVTGPGRARPPVGNSGGLHPRRTTRCTGSCGMSSLMMPWIARTAREVLGGVRRLRDPVRGCLELPRLRALVASFDPAAREGRGG